MAKLPCVLLLACSLIVSTFAAPGSVDIEKLTALPTTGDLQATHVFPTYSNKQFPAGKMVDVVLGIRNEGSQTYNVTMIAGSLNSPAEFKLYVQNFSQITYGDELKPGEELSLEYKFFPDPRLEPRDFVVALSAVYTDNKGKFHSLTFFNETINIIEVKQLIDWELIFLVLIFAAGFAGIGYFVYTYMVNLGWLKSTKRRTRSRRTPGEAPAPMSAEHQQEWLKGTPYDNLAKRKSSTSKRSPAIGEAAKK